jgi:hypothetical protein
MTRKATPIGPNLLEQIEDARVVLASVDVTFRRNGGVALGLQRRHRGIKL